MHWTREETTAVQPQPGGFHPETAPQALERARFVYDRQPPAAQQDACDLLPVWLAPHIPRLYSQDEFQDPIAFAKYFLSEGRWTFYVLEYSKTAPDGTPDLFFGYLLSPLGSDCDELCYVTLDQIKELRSPTLKLPIERDLWFRPKPLSTVQAEPRGDGDDPDPKPAPHDPGPVTDLPTEGAGAAPLPEGWMADDIRHLLGKLEAEPLLVADARLGIPTIHNFIGCRHLGFGMFELKTPSYTLSWDAGGAMQRTPSGKGWTYLHIDGNYAYDTKAVRATLEAWLRTASETPLNHDAKESETVPLPPAPVKNPYLAMATAQLNHELKQPPAYSEADVAEYERAWDVYFETGALATVRKAAKRIAATETHAIGILRVAYERADRGLSPSSLEARRRIIQGRIRQLEQAS